MSVLLGTDRCSRFIHLFATQRTSARFLLSTIRLLTGFPEGSLTQSNMRRRDDEQRIPFPTRSADAACSRYYNLVGRRGPWTVLDQVAPQTSLLEDRAGRLRSTNLKDLKPFRARTPDADSEVERSDSDSDQSTTSLRVPFEWRSVMRGIALGRDCYIEIRAVCICLRLTGIEFCLYLTE